MNDLYNQILIRYRDAGPMEYILGAVALTILLYAIFRVVKGGSAPSIEKELARLDESYDVVSGILLSTPTGILRIDHIIVSHYGIFVVTEVRGKGRISGDINQEEWHISGKTIDNPVWKNRTLSNILEEQLGKFKYIPLVVVVQGTLKSDFGNPVIKAYQVRDRIGYFTNRVISEEERQRILEKIQEWKV